MSHATHPQPPHPLVSRNPFRAATPAALAPPAFAAARSQLPEPVLPHEPGWVALYWRAWEIVWAGLHQPAPVDGLITSYLLSNGSEHVEMWETALLAQLSFYGRRALNLMAPLNNFYARQHHDGFICRTFNPATGTDFFYPFDPNSTGPNLLACTEWRYFRQSGDDGRIGQVFWPLLAYHHWLRDNRTWRNGLYWATGLSSQMANQPRVPDSRDHHRHWIWVDASLQAALNSHCLAQMAAQLGESDLAKPLQEEHTRLIDLINKHLWNDETQFYQDLGPDGRFSRVKSIGAYWALLDASMVPDKRLQPFIQPLRENWAFNLAHRVPSMSADSEGYNAETGNRWRGGVWPDLNFIVCRGLHNVRQSALAHAIARNHLQTMYQVYMNTGYLWEYYAPETAVAGAEARKNALIACLPPIAMLIEDVIGIRVDWPHRRVYWDRRCQPGQPYGIKNLPLGSDGTCELLGDEEQVTVVTDTPFTLVIRDASQSLQTAVDLGTTQIDLT